MLIVTTCAACGVRTRSRAPVCDGCAAAMRPAPSLPPPLGVDRCAAVLAYDGPARDVVARLKYRNQRAALGGLARAMAAVMAGHGHRLPDVVTWAPTTPERRRRRGFDHAELLARAVAAHLRRPCRPLLVRRPGPPQTGRRLAERRRAAPAFTARGRVVGHVLVVDDVVTSGATAAAAAAALRLAGAARIDVVAAARTPPPRTSTAAQVGAGCVDQVRR